MQGQGRMDQAHMYVWATLRADFAVLGDPLWSTMTAIFP